MVAIAPSVSTGDQPQVSGVLPQLARRNIQNGKAAMAPGLGESQYVKRQVAKKSYTQ